MLQVTAELFSECFHKKAEKKEGKRRIIFDVEK